MQRARDMRDIVLGGAEHDFRPVAARQPAQRLAGTRSRPSSACSSRAGSRRASSRGRRRAPAAPSSASMIWKSRPSRIRRATLRMTLESSTTRQVFIAPSLLTMRRARAPPFALHRPLMRPSRRRRSFEHAVDVENDQQLAFEPMHAAGHAREPRVEIDRIGLARRRRRASAPRRPCRSAGRRIRPCSSMPTAIGGLSSLRGGRPSRRRMSIAVTMRPRRLSTPAISGGASGTRVSRSGMNTSCTREIGRPNNWPPIITVTYSMTFARSCHRVHADPSRRLARARRSAP